MSRHTSHSHSNRRHGFTLLEVVAAIVLMTMLFAALTSLLRCFADQGRALERIAANYPSTATLSDLIRRDLTNAHSFRQTPNGLTLIGNLATNWETYRQVGRRAEVTYQIETIADAPWLVRRETHLDDLSSDRTRAKLVWRGATRIDFLSESSLVADDSLTELQSQQITEEPNASGAATLPSRVRMVVKNGNQNLVDVAVLHHWEDS